MCGLNDVAARNVLVGGCSSPGPGVKNWQRPQYPFMGLLDQFADEFLDEKNSVGGLESLRHDPIALDLEKWVRRARARNKVSCSEGAC